jgi:hypothetical protein
MAEDPTLIWSVYHELECRQIGRLLVLLGVEC